MFGAWRRIIYDEIEIKKCVDWTFPLFTDAWCLVWVSGNAARWSQSPAGWIGGRWDLFFYLFSFSATVCLDFTASKRGKLEFARAKRHLDTFLKGMATFQERKAKRYFFLLYFQHPVSFWKRSMSWRSSSRSSVPAGKVLKNWLSKFV